MVTKRIPQRMSGTARTNPRSARASQLAPANRAEPRDFFSPSTRIPRRHNISEASRPSGKPNATESSVLATAVASVCPAALTTVRRKPKEKSGGKRPERNFAMAEAASAEKSTPIRTSAARQETASKASAPPATRTRRGVHQCAGGAARLADAVELGPETAPMFPLPGWIRAACVEILQLFTVHA